MNNLTNPFVEVIGWFESVPTESQTTEVYERVEKDKLYVKIVEARDLMIADITGSSDPYCIISFGDEKVKERTRTIWKNLNPIWNFKRTFELEEDLENITMTLEVFDEDKFKFDDFLGYCTVQFFETKANEIYDKWITLKPRTWKEKVKGQIHIQYMYISAKSISSTGFSLKEIMKDPYASSDFLEFLREEWSHENLLFYYSVEEYKSVVRQWSELIFEINQQKGSSESTSNTHQHYQSMQGTLDGNHSNGNTKKCDNTHESDSTLDHETDNNYTESRMVKSHGNLEKLKRCYHNIFKAGNALYKKFIKTDSIHEINLDYELKSYYEEIFDKEQVNFNDPKHIQIISNEGSQGSEQQDNEDQGKEGEKDIDDNWKSKEKKEILSTHIKKIKNYNEMAHRKSIREGNSCEIGEKLPSMSDVAEVNLMERFMERFDDEEKLIHIFDIAQCTVYDILQMDCFPRFTKSKYYSKCETLKEMSKRILDIKEDKHREEALYRLVFGLKDSDMDILKELLKKKYFAQKKKSSMAKSVVSEDITGNPDYHPKQLREHSKKLKQRQQKILETKIDSPILEPLTCNTIE